MRTVDIQNFDVKVRTQGNDFLVGNFPCSLTQPEITRQRPFELTDIEYDLINMVLQRRNMLGTILLFEGML